MAPDGVALDPPLTLLLQACLLPDAAALAAWRAWQALRPFEDISGAEVRLLAPLSARLGTLDPASALLPRIRGIARARWTMAQLVLREAGEAAAALAEGAIPTLVFGAAATHVDDLGADTRREIGSVELLVPAESFSDAVGRLVAAGWLAADGASASFIRKAAPVRLRLRFLRGTHGDVALWRVPFTACRDDGTALDALWRHAHPAFLGGRPVLVPQATDAVLIALAQGGADGAWALEAARRVRRQPVDWARLVEASRRWRLSPVVAARLDVLIRDLGVGAEAAARLAEDRPTFAERARGRRGIMGRLARRVLAMQGYLLPPDDAAGMPVLRARRSKAAAKPGPHATRQMVDAGPGALCLGFPAEAIGRPFRIEASRDGAPAAVIRGRVRAAVHRISLPGLLELEARPPGIGRDGFGRSPVPTEAPVPFRAWRG